VAPCGPSGTVKDWALVMTGADFAENLPVVDPVLEGPGA
jgi:hypothetical protein